jgi:hypothetical protein
MVHSTRKNQGRNTPSPFEPAVFVNVNLEAEQKAEVKAAKWDSGEFDTSMSVLMVDGYKLSIRYDKFNDCFAAWLLPVNTHKNKGLILAGRGSTPMRAVKQLVYIHYKVLDGDWTSEQPQSREVLDD